MSTPVAQSSSSTEAEQTRNNVTCKFKYRIRLFYSKGAILVLIWQLLIIAAVSSQMYLMKHFYSGLKSIAWFVYLVPIIVFLVCALLCGWLADARFGKYKVFKTGSAISFSAVVMLCVCLLFFNNIDVSYVISTVTNDSLCNFCFCTIVPSNPLLASCKCFDISVNVFSLTQISPKSSY